MSLTTFQTTAIAIYLLSLLVLGYFAKRASRESTLKDYYLAGGTLGLVSLFFTLYATQYSGNSFFANPGFAYRTGIMGIAFVLGMMSVMLVYFLFAPQLNKLAKYYRFISVGDFISWRYQSRLMLIMVNSVLFITLVNFILANLKAVGLLVASASGSILSFAQSIALICFVMAIYESIAGMRGVIWTDILQGLILMSGCLIVFFALLATEPAGPIITPTQLLNDATLFLSMPSHWVSALSFIVLIAFAAAVYPQAIQRMYAAKDAPTLKRSYWIMFIMPLITTLPLFLIGISAASWFPNLSRQASEHVVIMAIDQLIQQLPSLTWLLVFYIGAAIAAIMSTIDSAMLSLGSIISKDIMVKYHSNWGEAKSHAFSRRLSWLLITLMAVLAIVLPQTIWDLLVLKLELLIQVMPAIILGVRYPTLPTMPLLLGLIIGAVLVIIMQLSSHIGLPSLHTIWGIHAGIWALTVNLLIVWASHKKYKSVKPLDKKAA